MIFLGVNLRVPSIHTHYTHRHDRSRNERDNWANCPPGVDHWIRPPRPPDCDDAVQNLGLYHHVQALELTSGLKLGHYMKIPHRPMFWCQIVGTVVAGTVQIGVQAWMFSNIEDLCAPDQRDGFTCPSTTVFGTASIIVSYC